MCVCESVCEALSRELNSDPCPQHPINTYIYGVTIAPRVCGGFY